jgi:hypothetical protein
LGEKGGHSIQDEIPTKKARFLAGIGLVWQPLND